MAFAISELRAKTEQSESKLRELELKIEQLTKSIESDRKEEASSNIGEITLYYWGLKNRGNGPRLLLTEAGVKYNDVSDANIIGTKVVCRGSLEKNDKRFDAFAPPLIEHNGVIISQTNAVMQYLAQVTGLRPKSNLDNALAQMVLANVGDVFSEIFRRRDEDAVKLSEFFNGRFRQWLDVLEKPLTHGGKREYYFDGRVTQADIGVVNLLDGLHEMLGDKYDAAVTSKHPSLEELYKRVTSRDRIKKFLDEQNKKEVTWIPDAYFGNFLKTMKDIKIV